MQQNNDVPVLPFPIFIWRIFLVFGVFLCSSYTIIVHLCEKDGRLPFSSAAVILMIELIKLLLSAIMFAYKTYQSNSNNGWLKCIQLKQVLYKEFCPTTQLQEDQSAQSLPSPSTTSSTHIGFKHFVFIILPYTIPALLYAFNNNLALLIQLEMDPATYQILSNFKILSTAILFRLIIKQRITLIQWFSLLLLLTAGIVHSYGNFDAQKAFMKSSSLPPSTCQSISCVLHPISSSTIHITTHGIIMISAYCTVSGLSGVYTEHVMKKHSYMSIHLQNFLLYTFGVIVNGIALIFEVHRKGISDEDFQFFRGFTYLTWILILTQSIFGMLIGFVLKYASNIYRLFIISSAMICTTLLAMILFNLHLNSIILMSIILVCTSLYLYYR
ncbi:unnamed protein product [Trichobilharzia szidati]|nr:unnamed protein product [Trichobilharzia szidati]